MQLACKIIFLLLFIFNHVQAVVANGWQEWRPAFVHVLNFTSSMSISAFSESDCAKYASQQEWPYLFRYNSASGICYLSEFEKRPDKNLTQPVDHYRCMTKVPPLKGNYYRVPNNNSPQPCQKKLSMTEKKYQQIADLILHHLLKSLVLNVFSNGVTNCIKNLGSNSEKIQFRSRQLVIEAWLLWIGKPDKVNQN